MPTGRTLRCGSASGERLAEMEPVHGSPNVYGLQLVQGLLAFAPVELVPAPLEPVQALLGPEPAPLKPAPGYSELNKACLGLELVSVVALECSWGGD